MWPSDSSQSQCRVQALPRKLSVFVSPVSPLLSEGPMGSTHGFSSVQHTFHGSPPPLSGLLADLFAFICVLG